MVFKSTDNQLSDTTGISVLESIQIKVVDEITSDEFIDLQSTVQVYPNPTTDRLTIDFDGGEVPKQLSIVLYNLQGQMMEIYTDQRMVDLSQYPKGNYIVDIRSNGRRLFREQISVNR